MPALALGAERLALHPGPPCHPRRDEWPGFVHGASLGRAMIEAHSIPSRRPSVFLLTPPAQVQLPPTFNALQSALLAAVLEAGTDSHQAEQALLRLINPPHPASEPDLKVLGQRFGPYLWALGRDNPKHPAAKLIARLEITPWHGVMKAPPQAGIQVYQALGPMLDGKLVDVIPVLIAAKAGVLLAQRGQDDIAEALLWGVISEILLSHYDAWGSHARIALERLFILGTDAILALPGGADAFSGPQRRVAKLVKTLPKAQAQELRRFMERMQATHGADFFEQQGRAIWTVKR